MNSKKEKKSKSVLNFIGERLRDACCYFTAFMVLPIVFVTEYASEMYIYVMLAFAIALSFIGLVMRIKNMSYLIKLTLHMVLTYGVFTLVFLLVNSIAPNGSVYTPTTYAFLAMAIAVLYVIFGIIGFFIQRGRKKEQSAEKYENQFKN